MTGDSPRSRRQMHGPLQSFEIKAEVSRLREEQERKKDWRKSITLRKGQGLSVVLMVMKAGDILDEHSAPGPISLVVREGRVRFTAAEKTVEAGTETVLTCDAGVSHSVEAVSDAVCLLHIAAGETAPHSG